MSGLSAYDELCGANTLSLGDTEFIHQHVVDAYAAQTCTCDDKPIRIFFAVVGLYLYLEHGLTGREVQQAHMKLARHRKVWPQIEIPSDRGPITSQDVLPAEPGEERRAGLHGWCEAVWESFRPQQDLITQVLAEADIIYRS